MSGLRERKKGWTREAIQREALRLIESRGYEATTCEQIASAAQVSPATLFRYFATKEDIVLQDGYDPMIAEAIRARPARGATGATKSRVRISRTKGMGSPRTCQPQQR